MSESDQFTQVLHKWAATFIHRSMADYLQFRKDSGLSMTQMNTLYHLHHCETCGISDIGEFLGISNAAASQLVDRLVQFHMVTRDEDPTDRRAKQLTLTHKGEDLIAKSNFARRRWMERLTDELSEDEKKSIVDALNLLTAAAEKINAEID
jgi:DNA-binding MarR family transcriptional regulator